MMTQEREIQDQAEVQMVAHAILICQKGLLFVEVLHKVIQDQHQEEEEAPMVVLAIMTCQHKKLYVVQEDHNHQVVVAVQVVMEALVISIQVKTKLFVDHPILHLNHQAEVVQTVVVVNHVTMTWMQAKLSALQDQEVHQEVHQVVHLEVHLEVHLVVAALVVMEDLAITIQIKTKLFVDHPVLHLSHQVVVVVLTAVAVNHVTMISQQVKLSVPQVQEDLNHHLSHQAVAAALVVMEAPVITIQIKTKLFADHPVLHLSHQAEVAQTVVVVNHVTTTCQQAKLSVLQDQEVHHLSHQAVAAALVVMVAPVITIQIKTKLFADHHNHQVEVMVVLAITIHLKTELSAIFF